MGFDVGIIKYLIIEVCWMTPAGARVFGKWLLAECPSFQPDPAASFKNSQ
jgi:hypothetical protein